MTLPLGPKSDLAHMAEAATAQGRLKLAKVCLLALAYIEQLEAELARIDANHRRAGLASADVKTHAQRKAWAIDAAKRRWCGRARINDSAIFESARD